MTIRRHPEGFTLLELMVVISVIAILAGLVLSAAGYVQKKGARSRAEAEVASVSAALENYKADNGDYPTNSSNNALSGNNTNLVASLMPTNGGKVYFEFRTNSLDPNNNFLDPFGTPYSYQYPGDTNKNGGNFYDLWSTAGGSNSTTGSTNSWVKFIKNW
jgi:type II secretion system protein G